MTEPIDMICAITDCSREDAERVYKKTGNILDAADELMVKFESKFAKYIPAKKVAELTEEQKEIQRVRNEMKKFDNFISNRPGHEELSVQQARLEETAQQNNCSQQCQLPSLEEEAEKQETACPSLCECSSDLPSSDQT